MPWTRVDYLHHPHSVLTRYSHHLSELMPASATWCQSNDIKAICHRPVLSLDKSEELWIVQQTPWIVQPQPRASPSDIKIMSLARSKPGQNSRTQWAAQKLPAIKMLSNSKVRYMIRAEVKRQSNHGAVAQKLASSPCLLSCQASLTGMMECLGCKKWVVRTQALRAAIMLMTSSHEFLLCQLSRISGLLICWSP